MAAHVVVLRLIRQVAAAAAPEDCAAAARESRNGPLRIWSKARATAAFSASSAWKSARSCACMAALSGARFAMLLRAWSHEQFRV